MNIEKKPILTISLLVSNRIDTIRKCMESIRPILEQVPSELIAVDTVGEETDGSIDVVKEYTDKIYPFAWCNDFSTARNEGLFRAQGEWFLFIDDDEWFEDVSEIIDFFRSGEYKGYNSATYRIRDYWNKNGGYSMGTLNRIVKLETDTKFVGKVHEYLVPMKLPCKSLESYVHHYGYVFENMEEHEKHSKRNLSLLRPEFEKDPWNLHLRLQMVQECMYLKQLEAEAIQLCEETMQMNKVYWMEPGFQWILTAYVRLADRNKEWEDVLQRSEQIRKRFPISAFTKLALSVMEIKANKQLEQYELVEVAAERFEESYLYLRKHDKQRKAQAILDFEVFMEDGILLETYGKVVVAYQKLGKKREAREWLQKRIEISKKPLLTISLLVSNNIATIKKCMESLAPLLQKISSELIVVDTIGEENSDGSLAVAKRYASKVVRFEWCNDFAAARNAGLEQAQGEWFLFLDDDEWFEDISEIIDFFENGEYLNYNSGTYQIRNYKDKEGKSYSTAVLGRMVCRRKNTRFIGTVHETFSEIYLPCKNFNAYVHHYGYVYETEEDKRKHIERNVTLLQKELQNNPKDLRFRAQMAMELATFDNEGALDFCEETFRICADKKEEPAFQWQMSLVFRLYEALGIKAEEAEKRYIELQHTFGYNVMTENAICYQMVRICLLTDYSERAYLYAQKYFETFAYLKEHSEEQQKQMTADFYRYQTVDAYVEILHFAAYSAKCAKEYVIAWNWYKEMPWEQESFQNEEAFWLLVELFRENPKKECFLSIVKRMMKNLSLMRKSKVKESISDILSDLMNGRTTEMAGRPQYIASKMKLTIGVLVSNSIETIRKCMESLKPILDAVSSELIVVDTKGEETDGSIAIAKEYANKVYTFKWCNDFSAARNVCIDHAEGEWFLFVDDDEWFDDVNEIIDFFNSEESNKYGSGLYSIRNYTMEGTYTETVVSRFVRRTEKTRFVGKVHEVYNEVYFPQKYFKTFAHHSGYQYKNEEEKKSHQKRNVMILEEELKLGYVPHTCAQMAQELLHVRDTWKEGQQFCLECIPVLVNEQGAINNPGTQWVLTATARYYSMTDDFKAFTKRVYFLKNNYQLSQMAELLLAALSAYSFKEMGKVDEAERAVKEYLSLREWLEKNEEQRISQSTLDFINFYNQDTYYKILHIGAQCANEQGDYERANQYWKKISFEQEVKVQYWNDMQETMQGLKKAQESRKKGEKLKELCLLLASLAEAEAYVVRTWNGNKTEEVNAVFAGMQEAAITIGTSLDQLLGEGTEEVSLLEQYCEFIWNCSNTNAVSEARSWMGEMKKITQQVEQLLQARITNLQK